jgi:hypothetical protein
MAIDRSTMLLLSDKVVQHVFKAIVQNRSAMFKRLTENELSDFSRLWHDGCVEAIIEAQDVDRNHSTEV